MKAHVILGAIATLLLGCDSSSTSSSPTSASASVVTVPPVTEVAQGVTFKVAPDTLRECDPPAEVALTWDASATRIPAVKIFIVGGDGKESLFAHLPALGKQATGPWMRANDAFVLKDESEATQLGKLVIGSATCE
jgi:hypothetical protein